MAGNDLAKFILDTLKEYDYRNVSRKECERLSHTRSCVGLVDFGRRYIRVASDISFSDKEQTQLHEFAHVYFHRLNRDASEEEVEALANVWVGGLYGLL